MLSQGSRADPEAKPWPHAPIESPWAFSAVVAFGMLQPVLDLIGRFPEFLVAHHARATELVSLAVAAVALASIAALAGWLLVRHAPRLGGPTVAFVLALFGSFLGWHVHRVLALPEIFWVGVPFVVGGVVWLWFRWSPLRGLGKLLLPAPLVFVAAFLIQGDVRRAVASSGDVGSGERMAAEHPVFVLVFDEWSFVSLLGADGELDRRRLPNLASFVDTATWYRNASTVSETTAKAVPAIVTGLMPTLRQLPTATDYPNSLFTFLSPSYRLRCFEPISRLCPDSLNEAHAGRPALRELLLDLRVVWLHQVLPPPLAAGLPDISHGWGGFVAGADRIDTADLEAASARLLEQGIAAVTGGGRPDEFVRFLDTIDADPAVAYFFHSLLPHRPWEYLESGERYVGEPTPGLFGEMWAGTWSQVEVAYARYEAQVEFVDHLLGQFLARLRELGIFDRSIVVLAGDHGVSFRPGLPRRDFVAGNAADLAAIPLFVKAPGQTAGRVVEFDVTTLDIVPTVLDLLHAQAPWPLDGHAALVESPPAYPEGLPFVIGSLSRGVERRTVRLSPELHQLKYETLDWKRELLVSWEDGRWSFAPRAHRALVGRLLEDLDVGPASGFAVRLMEPSSQATWRFVRGVLETAVEIAHADLALAQGGRIVTVTQAVGGGGVLPFTALLPSPVEPTGPSPIEVLLIREGPDGPRLESLSRFLPVTAP